MTWPLRLLAVFAVALLGSYEYRIIQTAGFVYEDPTWTAACQSPQWIDHLTSFRGFPRTGALFSWCWQLQQGHSALAFHVVNLALHGLVSLLLGVLIFQLTANEAVAWSVGALFALHPLAIESAIYLGGRGELIAGIGVLLACIAALERLWVIAWIGLLIGLLGKESAIVAVVAVPIVLAVKARASARVVAWTAALLTLSGLVASLAAQLVRAPGITIPRWILIQATAFIRLSVLAVLPLGQTPAHDYAGLGAFWQLLCLLGVVGLIVWAWRLKDQQPLVAAGLAWLVLTALPRFVVPTPPSVFNEHQFYVPLMGVACLAAAALIQMPVRPLREWSL